MKKHINIKLESKQTDKLNKMKSDLQSWARKGGKPPPKNYCYRYMFVTLFLLESEYVSSEMSKQALVRCQGCLLLINLSQKLPRYGSTMAVASWN